MSGGGVMGNLRRKASIVLLILIAVFFMADQNLLAPNYQIIMDEFGITESQMGLVSSVFVATSALITIVWGFLVDIHTRKKLLLIGVLLGEIPCFLTAFVTNYWQLLLIRTFTGIGIGSIIPIGYSLIADYFKTEARGKGYGFIETAFGLGTLLGMILAGIIPSWRPPFIMVSVPNFFLAPLFYIVAEEPKKGEGDRALEKLYEKGLEYTYRLSWDAVKKSFTTRTNVLIFIQGILGTVPWGVLVYWLVSFLQVTRGLDKMSATFVLLILGVASVIGSLIGGILGDIFENRRRGGRSILTGLAIFIGMLATIGIILYPIPSELTLKVWVFIAIYSIALIQLISYAGPNVRAIISQVNPPDDRGTVFGVFNIMDNIGKAIGPVLGGIFIEMLVSMGYSEPLAYMWTMIFGSLFWIPCAAVWIWLVKWYPRDKEALDKMLEERARKLLEKA